jgi:UDP-GlcNAc:undecaprenyl-phosphate GlcNAc-1-phosphate transferase
MPPTEQPDEPLREYLGIFCSVLFMVLCGLAAWITRFYYRGLRHVAYVAFVSSLSVVLITPLVMMLAHRRGAVDHPGEARKIHRKSIPRWGGIAIFCGILFGALYGYFFLPDIQAVMLATSLIFVVGVLDDLHGLNEKLRGFAQIGASLLLVFCGIRITLFPPTWWGDTLEVVLTVLWLVGITNAVNFLDGMNGLVAGIGATSGLTFTLLALLLNQPALAYCSVALFAACVTFLGYNTKPARIFMGDCGSTTIGFLLGALGLLGTWSTPSGSRILSFLVPVCILSVAIYDMVFTTIERVLTGKVRSFSEWLSFTGTDHIHHRFNALGWDRTQTVLVIWFLNFSVSLSAVMLINAPLYFGLVVIVQVIFIYIIVAMLELIGMRNRRISFMYRRRCQSEHKL